ncbi:MAG TPA: response regulator [Gaiellaceae bacterium]|nr:response regulator [Gaiellaceae bacterium]
MTARLVIADDSSSILAMIVLSVRRDGYEPVTATDGLQALEAIREHRPALVILDAMMPGATGYEVCKTLRDDPDGPKPYVIMITAGGRASDRQNAEDAGVDEFFTKPFSPSELRGRVRAILGDP